MKRATSLVLIPLLLLCMLLPVQAEESTYPTAWDLSELFLDDAAWQAAYEQALEGIEALPELRGKLQTPKAYQAYFDADEQLTQIINPLYGYAYFRYSLNPGDVAALQMLGKLDALFVALSQNLAFLEPEIASIPLEQRTELFADENLTPFAYALSEYLEEDFDPLPEEVATALSYLSPAVSQISTIRDVFATLEVPKVSVTLTDGTEMLVGEQEYVQFIYSDAAREDKALMNEAYVKQYAPYQNTFAAILQGKVAAAWGSAQINGYDSVLEMQLDESNVDPAVYDIMIQTAYDNAGLYTRNLALLKQALGLETMYPFDTAEYASGFEPESLSYDNMVDEVREALRVLGEDYIEAYDQMVTGGFIDVYPTETKMTGAYSLGIGGVAPAYIMLNNYGIPGEASTLAHEMGHALYEYFTQQNQHTMYWNIPIFTHEVASTTNELLYYLYKMEHAATEEERLYYLEECIGMFGGTLFIQCLYAEFEDRMYRIVEAGGVLDAQTLNDTWASLYEHYRGDTVTTFEGFETLWAQIPHFLGSSYYVYQYATSVTYAAAIVRNLRNGEASTVEAYLDFLKAGASAQPAELLKNVGVDPLDKATYDSAMQFYQELLDDYEALIANR